MTKAPPQPAPGDRLSFIAVGGSAFILGAAMVEGLIALGMSPYAAQLPTQLAGATYTWWLNRHHTFDVPRRPTIAEYVRYLISSAGGFMVSMAVFSLLVWLGVPAFVALGGGTVAALCFNYLSYSRYAFALPRPPAD